jgi:hypothetical protein
MLRRLLKSKKAQNTAEYAILISLVVAGIIAMQTYAQRALQGRVRDATKIMTEADGGDGSASLDQTKQYEPYYLDTDYNVITNDTTKESYVGNSLTQGTDSDRTRQQNGRRITSYNANMFQLDENGL